MRKNKRKCFAWVLLLALILFLALSDKIRKARQVKPVEFVAHAGGYVDGIYASNSLQALEASYQRGLRFIELDFNWTSDNQLVVIHDWRATLDRLFTEHPQQYSLAQFKQLKMINNLTQLTLPELSDWLKRHRNAFIVTDIKQNNLKGLEQISQRYSVMRRQIIPQIYSFDEYDPAKGLGFDNLILTLYTADYSDDLLLEFLSTHPVLAVTMPISRAQTGLPEKLDQLDIFVYAHTVNQKERVERLKAKDVDGFYTDLLKP